VDTAGNLIIEAGPDRDTAVIIAHLDEIGFRIDRIDHDGTALLAPVGGFFASLWEGQPALAHPQSAPGAACAEPSTNGVSTALNIPEHARTGVFVPRADATRKQPDTLRVWFGLDSAGLAACGIGAGTRVSGYKHPAARLAATRFTARSIDDRAGCAALLLALRRLDPATLDHKVIFIWSTREEVGLDGAAAAAAELGPSVRRVYAVDTFVSSDSPLESRRFAYAPIGAGAVLRALDNSGVTPPDEVRRMQHLAAAHGIPLQAGTTNGGNDGSTFVPFGAVNVALAWPLRYSHSPAEVVDLRDIGALARIVEQAARSPNSRSGE
jgi:putative aminopeptidase FrvX